MQSQSVLGVHYCLERVLRVFVLRQRPPDALEHRGPAVAVSRVSRAASPTAVCWIGTDSGAAGICKGGTVHLATVGYPRRIPSRPG